MGSPQHAPPSQDLPSFRRGASPTHLAVHHHIKADPVGFKQRAELHPSCVSVILGKPGGDTAWGALGLPVSSLFGNTGSTTLEVYNPPTPGPWHSAGPGKVGDPLNDVT